VRQQDAWQRGMERLPAVSARTVPRFTENLGFAVTLASDSEAEETEADVADQAAKADVRRRHKAGTARVLLDASVTQRYTVDGATSRSTLGSCTG
jgi:hypothetical protein